MRTVRFPWAQRLEMAVAWAFPISLLALLLLPIWPSGTLLAIALAWGFACAIFLGFPLYARRLVSRPSASRTALFNLGLRALPLLAWLALFAGYAAGEAALGELSAPGALRWTALSLTILSILSLDLTGSTPTCKSRLHPDRLLRIALEPERCKSAAFCQQVCPKDVFVVDRERRRATLPRAEQCVQCGACIVQCPFDALAFASPTGDVVPPETIREFKLNLLGHRMVRRPEEMFEGSGTRAAT